MEIRNSLITFWFNKQSNPKIYVDKLNNALKEYFFEFSIIGVPANIDPSIPRLKTVSSSNYSNIEMSLINLRLMTNFDDNFWHDADKCLNYLKERALILFDVLNNDCEIPIMYSAIMINIDEQKDNPDNLIINHFFKKDKMLDNMSEIGVRLSQEVEGKYYKNINFSNIKQIKVDKMVGINGAEFIFPLISLDEASEIQDILLINLEINDKLGFNNNKEYVLKRKDFERMFELTLKSVENEINRFGN